MAIAPTVTVTEDRSYKLVKEPHDNMDCGVCKEVPTNFIIMEDYKCLIDESDYGGLSTMDFVCSEECYNLWLLRIL